VGLSVRERACVGVWAWLHRPFLPKHSAACVGLIPNCTHANLGPFPLKPTPTRMHVAFGTCTQRRGRAFDSHLHPFPLRPIPTLARSHLHAHVFVQPLAGGARGLFHNGSGSEGAPWRPRVCARYRASIPCGDGPAPWGAAWTAPRAQRGARRTLARVRGSNGGTEGYRRVLKGSAIAVLGTRSKRGPHGTQGTRVLEQAHTRRRNGRHDSGGRGRW
jgi:hypothetical protein